MELEDLPIVGRLVTVLAFAGDLLVNSGDLLVALVFGLGEALITNIDTVVPLLSTVDRLAERLAWIPAGLVEDLLLVGLVALTVVYTARIIGIRQIGD
jgi:hypothetical protein